MKFVLVTHADPDYRASGVLSDKGRQGTEWLAKKCRESLPKNAAVVSILSSPRTRCIETATILASELGRGFAESKLNGERREHGKPWDDIPATRIHVREELDEQSAAFNAEDLQRAIITGHRIAKPQIKKLIEEKKDYTPVVVVALHGDLANALNGGAHSYASWDQKKTGWFFDRKPVLLILNYTPGQRLSELILGDPIKAELFPEDNAKCDPLLINVDVAEAS